jgi:hypothetical protein
MGLELFEAILTELPEGKKCLTKYENMYFVIDDYDVRYFDLNNKMCLEINTYPIKPAKLGETLFKVRLI